MGGLVDASLVQRLAAEVGRREARVVVLTGAGVSAPSGVPTFRGQGGLWRDRRPDELATPEAFAADPRLVWEWYDARRVQVARCQPNAAHDVLATWSRRLPHFRLVTQNVDGLHERAGTAGVLRFHGSLWEVLCTNGCGRRTDLRVPLPELPPLCSHCRAPLRPGVVWFGEPIDADVLAASVAAASACDVLLVVGTSSLVYPAASLLEIAAEAGATLIDINPEPAAWTDRHGALAVRAPAEIVLPEIEALLATRVSG